MMHFLANTYYLLLFTRMSFQANREQGRYHHRVRSRAAGLISQAQELNDGSIPEKAYRKIQWYMVSTLFMGELAAHLAGYRIRSGEERAYCYLGALIGLSDILVDDYQLEAPALEALLQQHPGDTPIERMFSIYYQALFRLVDAGQAERLKAAFAELIHYQVASLRQFDTGISEQDTIAITRGKGGASLKLCAALLPGTEGPMQEALYELGGFIQFLNDAQDLPKDAREGVVTFVRFRQGFPDILQYIEAERRRTFHSFSTLALKRSRLRYFLFCFHAMFVLITYKLGRYARLCAGELDMQRIAVMDEKIFRANPFSMSFIRAALWPILSFRLDRRPAPSVI